MMSVTLSLRRCAVRFSLHAFLCFTGTAILIDYGDEKAGQNVFRTHPFSCNGISEIYVEEEVW